MVPPQCRSQSSIVSYVFSKGQVTIHLTKKIRNEIFIDPFKQYILELIMILLELVIEVVWFSNTYQIQTILNPKDVLVGIKYSFGLIFMFSFPLMWKCMYLLRCTTFPFYQNITHKNLPNCQHPRRSSCCTCLLGSRLSL